MNGLPTQRGTALLLAHCSSLDPAALPARERLELALGPELAGKLLYALCSRSPSGALGARAVFAA
jgi:hypothetical protein